MNYLSTELKFEFIEMALQAEVLKFGEFKLKSGRLSPYFFNAGLFYRNDHLKKLGQYYAELLLTNSIQCNHLFGPAYKGIPLVTATAIALADKDVQTTVTFNRKEAKDHGEGGILIGAPLSGETVIIDDVITAGTAFKEAQSLIEATESHIAAVLVALNRCERGMGMANAIEAIRAQGIPVYYLIDVFDLISYLDKNGEKSKANALNEYQSIYGV